MMAAAYAVLAAGAAARTSLKPRMRGDNALSCHNHNGIVVPAGNTSNTLDYTAWVGWRRMMLYALYGMALALAEHSLDNVIV